MNQMNASERLTDLSPAPLAGRRIPRLRQLAVLAAAVALAGVSPMHAAGLRLPGQDAAAIARGNAFVATADNPSAVYYNPAGITQTVGQSLQVGSLFNLGTEADYTSPDGTRYHNDEELLAVPTLYYAITPSEQLPLSLGLGIYKPFGFSVQWPQDVPFRSEALEGRMDYFTFNPVVAWKVLPTLSLAVGPTFNYSQLKIKQGILGVPAAGYEVEFKGHNWGYGFNAGVLWQPLPQWSFGASYRSSSAIDYDGNAEARPAPPLPSLGATSARINFPQTFTAGVSYRPCDQWNIEVDVDWADWASVDRLVIQAIQTRPLGWEGSFTYSIGVTRSLGRGYFVSAGYSFSEAATPDSLFTPLVVDTDLHTGSLGGGYKGEHWSWALAAQLAGGAERNVAVDPAAVSSTVNGRYQLFTPSLAFSVGYHF